MRATTTGGWLFVIFSSLVRTSSVTYQVDKKPLFCIDSFLIEEKGSAYETLGEPIGRESRKPQEHVEADTGLEHEKGNCLLKEQSDQDGAPLDMGPVLGGRPKAELKHDQTNDGDCTVTVFRVLVVGSTRISERFYMGFIFPKKKKK